MGQFLVVSVEGAVAPGGTWQLLWLGRLWRWRFWGIPEALRADRVLTHCAPHSDLMTTAALMWSSIRERKRDHTLI